MEAIKETSFLALLPPLLVLQRTPAGHTSRTQAPRPPPCHRHRTHRKKSRPPPGSAPGSERLTLQP
eukprot:572074-Hanusia_phi.AAC.1